MISKTIKKKWLITGVAGFIGSNLAEFLLAHNQKVIGVDNFSTGSKKNINTLLRIYKKNFEFKEGDICNVNFCKKITKNINIILHHAALGSVPRSIHSPIESHNTNVNGFLNMIYYSNKNNIEKFIYASSSSVYGDSVNLPKKENKIGNVLSPYALNKKINELYSEIFFKVYNFQSIGLRYFNVFGNNQNPNGQYAAVIPRWVNAVQNNKKIYVFGDGSTSRDFCYIKNVIQANILAALTKKKFNHITFNISCGNTTSLNDLLDMINKIFLKNGHKYKNKIIYKPFREGDIMHSKADISLAKKHLNYNPNYSIYKGLDEFINQKINF